MAIESEIVELFYVDGRAAGFYEVGSERLDVVVPSSPIQASTVAVDLRPLDGVQALREISVLAENPAYRMGSAVLPASLPALEVLLVGSRIVNSEVLSVMPRLRRIRMWGSLDRATLERLVELEDLRMGVKSEPAGSPDWFPVLPRLRRLELESVGKARLEFLAELPALRSLKLTAVLRSPARVVRRLTGLEELGLEVPSGSLGFLEGLRELRSLRLRAPAHSLTSLQELPLEELHLFISNLRDDAAAPIARLTGLRELRLGSRRISALDWLESLVRLEALDLSDCHSIERLDPLSALRELRRLDLSGIGRVRSFRPLLGLRSLQTVHLHGVTPDDHREVAALIESLPNTTFIGESLDAPSADDPIERVAHGTRVRISIGARGGYAVTADLAGLVASESQDDAAELLRGRLASTVRATFERALGTPPHPATCSCARWLAAATKASARQTSHWCRVGGARRRLHRMIRIYLALAVVVFVLAVTPIATANVSKEFANNHRALPASVTGRRTCVKLTAVAVHVLASGLNAHRKFSGTLFATPSGDARHPWIVVGRIAGKGVGLWATDVKPTVTHAPSALIQSANEVAWVNSQWGSLGRFPKNYPSAPAAPPLDSPAFGRAAACI